VTCLATLFAVVQCVLHSPRVQVGIEGKYWYTEGL